MQLEKYRLCSHLRPMTTRRTDADKLRRTISQLLEQAHSVEDLMEVFHRKTTVAALDRAAEHFNEMLGHVDELGELISEARAKQRETDVAV
jgi:hypothetical protein